MENDIGIASADVWHIGEIAARTGQVIGYGIEFSERGIYSDDFWEGKKYRHARWEHLEMLCSLRGAHGQLGGIGRMAPR